MRNCWICFEFFGCGTLATGAMVQDPEGRPVTRSDPVRSISTMQTTLAHDPVQLEILWRVNRGNACLLERLRILGRG